ncbi:MAG: hypothetical protein ABIS86_00010 [Streptosporangiaceae bacterium]
MVSLVCLVALPSAGCAGGPDAALPPQITSSSYPLFADDPTQGPQAEGTPATERPGSRPPDFPARLVLMRFLRGAGAGNPKVCGWVSPEYDQKVFSVLGGCARWVASIGPGDRARLRVVTVPAATGSPAAWTVRAASLVWPKGKPTTPKATFFVLRKPGSRWLLSV